MLGREAARAHLEQAQGGTGESLRLGQEVRRHAGLSKELKSHDLYRIDDCGVLGLSPLSRGTLAGAVTT